MNDETAGRLGGRLSFNLIDQQWLPVQLHSGSETQLSLRELFEQAGSIRRLVGDVPTQDFALIRLLLAIVHDALEGPKDVDEWDELWHAQVPFEEVPGYLERHRERFDLLHPVDPFFQTPDLRTTKDEIAPLNRIVVDVPNGEPFFTTRFPGVDRISFAEAARWVVHAHAYDTSGIKSGVIGDDRAKQGKAYPQGVGWSGNLGAVLAEGTSLRETLLLNLIATEHLGPDTKSVDRPAWRRPTCRPGSAVATDSHRPSGIRDLYTWQTRRVRLRADAAGVYGVVLTYGDPLAPQNKQTHEPMTGWRRSTAQEKKLSQSLVYMPQEHDPSRAAWRGLAALISPVDQNAAASGEAASALRPRVVDWIARLCTERALPKGTMIRVHTYGMVYGTQQSVVDEIVEDGVSMAVVLLNEENSALGQMAIDAVAEADTAVRILGKLASDLAVASMYNDKRRVQGDEKTVAEIARDGACERGFAQLDGHFRKWLGAIRDGDDPTVLHARWRTIVRREIGRLGADLIAAAGDAAWNGRVVEVTKGTVAWRNDASAERWFQIQLGKELPPAPLEKGATESGQSDDVPDSDSQKVLA